MYRLSVYGRTEDFEHLESAISTALYALEIDRDISNLIRTFYKQEGFVVISNPEGATATIEEV